MKLSVFPLLFRTPAVHRFSRRMSPETLLALCRLTVGVSRRFNPHTRRYLRPLLSVIEPHVDQTRLREIAANFLAYRRYADHLPYIWNEQLRRGRKFFVIEGEEHIKNARAKGKGAIILCSHFFGINPLIPAVIAAFGYSISRAGAWDEDSMARVWGDHTQRSWRKIHLTKGHWHRLRTVKKIAAALNDNGLVLLSMTNRPTGSPEQEVCAFGRKFYVNTALLPLLEHLETAVLPCFGLCDQHGKLRIIVHAPLQGSREEILRTYGRLLSEYLSNYPDFCRFWKPLLQQRDKW